jgi:cytochrome c oxidase assembly protein subunit 15
MVSIGGLTRLTNSGLSITEWKPITGVIPPLTGKSWQIEMQKYQKTPEYREYNFDITIDEFKKIYLIEYFHRLFGRFTGILFIVPFLYLLFSRKLSKQSLLILISVLLLGLLQGFIGWYMVKSGLADSPHVSHYRLAFHLFLAAIIFSFLWYECSPKPKLDITITKKILFFSYLLLFFTFIQIILGAFVAGMKAGLIYNTFPLMNGKLIPDEIFALNPVWMNFLQNQAGVQFLHRANGILIFIFVLILTIYFYMKKSNLKYFFNQFLLIILFQVLIGVFTLIYQVPIIIALIHQIIAFIVLGFNITLVKSLSTDYSCVLNKE